jgi:hypothetical protein
LFNPLSPHYYIDIAINEENFFVLRFLHCYKDSKCWLFEGRGRKLSTSTIDIESFLEIIICKEKERERENMNVMMMSLNLIQFSPEFSHGKKRKTLE